MRRLLGVTLGCISVFFSFLFHLVGENSSGVFQMITDGFYNLPHWYAVQTKPNQEDRAVGNLTAWNVETFAPKIMERNVGGNFQRPARVAKPLFPQYIFARFEAHAMLHKICFTRGVKRVVCFGDAPAAVEDEIIDLIKSRSNKDGVVEIVEALVPGDRIIINQGHLKNFTGIFERYMKGKDRVAIMIDTITFQNRLVLESDWVTKATSHSHVEAKGTTHARF